MILVKRCSALILAALLLTALPLFTATAAAPAAPEEPGSGLPAQLLHWLDLGLDHVLAGLGGFGGTGDDGMGLDPDGGGGDEDDGSGDPPPSDDGSSTEEGGSSGS